MAEAYNVSSAARADYIAVDSSCHAAGDRLTYLYGGAGSVPVAIAPDGTHYVQLHLNGRQFCILTEAACPAANHVDHDDLAQRHLPARSGRRRTAMTRLCLSLIRTA